MLRPISVSRVVEDAGYRLPPLSLTSTRKTRFAIDTLFRNRSSRSSSGFKFQLSGPPASGCTASFKQETGTRFDSDLLRGRGSTPCFVGAQMCRRTPLSWKESFEPGTVPVLRAQEGSGGGGYNALPEGSLCRIRPGQPGSSANLTLTKRGSALRRRSRQDSSQRVIKFQVSPVPSRWPDHSEKKLSSRVATKGGWCRKGKPSFRTVGGAF